MADTTSPRRILQELPVNTHGTSSASILPASTTVGLKRRIAEVDDPAAAPVASRLRESDNTESSSLKLQQTPSTTAATMASPKVPIKIGAGMMEENTQDTSNDTASTIVDSDVEGDTMDTQQTAATELSQVTETEPLSLRIPSRELPGQTPSVGLPTVPKYPSQPTLLPAPVLKPTIHSARRARRSEMLSSPPSSGGASPTKNSSPELFRTSALPRQQAPHIQQMSSPPDSQDGGPRGAEADDSHLNSSAVKGYAARSLMDLRDERGL
ncbi:MAG: hypothetical protein Q9225_002122 [Loekoesia sp. 1 TL-2023]